MTIYVDLILLANFLLDFSLITYTGIITKDKYKLWRVLLASIFAVMALGLIYIRLLWLFFILRVIWSLLIILIAFKFISIKQFIFKLVTFYFLNYLVAGIILSYNFSLLDKSLLIDLNSKVTWLLLIISFILANILTYIYMVMNDRIRELKNDLVDITFTFLNNEYQAKGLIDTGNKVHLNNIPVIFIDRSLFSDTINETYLLSQNISFTYVKYKTIRDNHLSLAFKPDKFSVLYQDKYYEKDVYIALADNLKNQDQTFNVILNANILLN